MVRCLENKKTRTRCKINPDRAEFPHIGVLCCSGGLLLPFWENFWGVFSVVFYGNKLCSDFAFLIKLTRQISLRYFWHTMKVMLSVIVSFCVGEFLAFPTKHKVPFHRWTSVLKVGFMSVGGIFLRFTFTVSEKLCFALKHRKLRNQ